jgi:DnaJ-domain-containing protein 1
VGAGAPRVTVTAAPAATYGLRAREVTAAAALAAGLALEGMLAQDGALRLFYLAAATQASGRLTLRAAPRAFALVFKRGTVEHASSTNPEDALDRHLMRRGVVTPAGLARASGAGGDLVAALIGLGLVAPADAAAALQEHGTALVARALAVESGAWRWEPGVTPPPSSFPLGASWALLPAAIRALDAATVQRRLGDRETRAASRVGGRIRSEDLRLTPQETRLLAAFDGVRSVAELAQAQPSDAVILLRLALLLGETELLAFGTPRRAAPVAAPPPVAAPSPVAAPPPVAAPRPAPGPAAPAAPPSVIPMAPPAAAPKVAPSSAPKAAPPAPQPLRTPSNPVAAAPKPSPALDRTALEAVYAKLQGADHFAVLGLKHDAMPAAIKAAYFSLAKLYHPDTVPPDVSPEAKQRCADVFSRVSEAWSVLGDDERRAEYQHALATGGTEKVDVQAIFRAEHLFQQGTLLVKARRYDEARAAFVEAMKLNADEAEFGMWKAWCEFLLAPDKKRQQAASAAAIEAELRRNARCAQGHLFLGQMAKLAGDLSAAEKHLRRGLAVDPDQPDLQRELKYLRK